MALYDGVLVAKIGRLTRKRDWDIRQWAEDHGKKILVVSPELEWPPNPGDVATPIIWDDLVNLAAGEWENTSQRYRRMQKELREQQYFVGQAPYGLHIVEVDDGSEHKTLAPDPVQGPIVRGMAKRYLSGESTRQIARWLNSEAIAVPNPRRVTTSVGWRNQMVMRVLRNPAIMGRVQTGGRTYMKVEPLISAEVFHRIQQLMTSKAHRGAPLETTALLTGIVVCDKGHAMYRIKMAPKPNAPDGLFYYCNPEHCPKGERVLVPCILADEQINEAVMSIGDQPHFVYTPTAVDDYTEAIQRVRGDIRELDLESDEDEVRRTPLRAELKRLRGLQEENKNKPVKNERRADRKPDGTIRTVGEYWESLDTPGKRQWLLDRGWKMIVSREPQMREACTAGR